MCKTQNKSFCLSLNSYDFANIYNAELPPVELKVNARNFYLWIWEEFFPDEDYHLKNPEQYELTFISSETYLL